VKVLAVGRDVGGAARETNRYQKDEGQTDANPLITLALTSQEAALIAFVQEQGRIRLILRSPSDSEVEPMQITSWDALFRYLVPPDKQASAASAQAEADAAAQKAKSAAGYVEVYRGMNKEKVPLSP